MMSQSESADPLRRGEACVDPSGCLYDSIFNQMYVHACILLCFHAYACMNKKCVCEGECAVCAYVCVIVVFTSVCLCININLYSEQEKIFS